GEAVHAALGVDQLLAAREERVAVGADLEVQILFGGAGLPRRAAGAVNRDLVVIGMDAGLHDRVPDLPDPGSMGTPTVHFPAGKPTSQYSILDVLGPFG